MAENMKMPIAMKSSKQPTCTHKHISVLTLSSDISPGLAHFTPAVESDLLVALSQREAKGPEARRVASQLQDPEDPHQTHDPQNLTHLPTRTNTEEPINTGETKKRSHHHASHRPPFTFPTRATVSMSPECGWMSSSSKCSRAICR